MAQNYVRGAAAISHNCRVKWIPGEEAPCEVLVFSKDVFREAGWEEKNICSSSSRAEKSQKEEKDEKICDSSSNRSWARARRHASDLIRSNSALNMFVTLTISPESFDRTDYKSIVGGLNRWLDNRVRRKGLLYVIVPEYHHDGKSIHFHGLMNESALSLVNSGHKRRGKVVYNINDFPFGFTTALRVSGAEASKACAGYIFKYMTKSGGQKVGGRYFLHGGKLLEPEIYYFDADFAALDYPSRLLDWGAEVKAANEKSAVEALQVLGLYEGLLKQRERFTAKMV